MCLCVFVFVRIQASVEKEVQRVIRFSANGSMRVGVFGFFRDEGGEVCVCGRRVY